MKKALIIFAILSASIAQSFSQTPDLIEASATEEGAITLRWISQTNSIYRIEYADELLDSATVWKTLYLNYPSHGTNTFWLDSGNYLEEPIIKHPKDNPARFYRIVETGTNNAPKPTISIISHTNNAVFSDEITVTVSATNSWGFLSTKLFVDGEEVDETEDGTNFVINTCEWLNGEHVLFAVAKASMMVGSPFNPQTVSNSYAVSSFVNVSFDNYVSRISFSEHFFEPDLGQTQRVSAVFGAYSDWTLEIVDESTNVVRTATGTNFVLQFDWDGTGDGNTSLPNGVYYYSISASESASEPPPPEEGGGVGGDGPPSPSSASFSGTQTEGNLCKTWF